MSKNLQKKNKIKKTKNDLEEPLQGIELQVKNDQNKISSEDNIEEKLPEKQSFCSKLFFLWTLIVMKLSNKNQLKIEVLRESPLFTSPENQNKFQEEFKFIKQLWEGKNNKGGFNKWNFSPLIFTIIRFNLVGLLYLLFLLFIAQLGKMIMLFFKRRIIQLFFERELNKIYNYNTKMFRIVLTQNIACFVIIELFRFILNHQLKYGQRKLTRKSSSLISLLIYDKYMMQKLLPNNMKEGDLINYLQTDTESMASFFFTNN